MNRTWISMIAAAAVCLTGVSATVAQQVYNTQPSSCQQCYSTPQYQTYESVSQPIQDGYASSTSYQPNTLYQGVVIGSSDSGQAIYSDPVYYDGSMNSNSGVVSSSYPSVGNSISSYPTQPTQGSVQVYSAPEVYQTQGYPSQNFQTTQSYSGASYNSPTVQSVQTVSGNHYASTNPQPGLAQQKADQAAQMRYRNHIGGGLGGAKFEGVGWSNQSQQSAIQNCCYWGQRSPAQIGVAKSSDGCWYACVLYH